MNRLSRDTNPYAAPALSSRQPTVVDRERRTRSRKRFFVESLAFVAGFYLAIVIHSLWIDYPLREALLDAFTHIISLAVFVVNIVVNTVVLRKTERSVVLNIIGGVAVIYGGLWLIDHLPPIAGPDGLPLISLVVSAVLSSLMVTGVTAAFESLRTAEIESATEQRGYDEGARMPTLIVLLPQKCLRASRAQDTSFYSKELPHAWAISSSCCFSQS